MPKTIFVVDDNDTNLIKAEEVLEDHYNVITLPSAEKMFGQLERLTRATQKESNKEPKTPHMILLDIEMPETDGFAAIRRLKASPAYADIPVIFLTSHVHAEIEAQGFELGAVDFISKPFFTAVLLNRIKLHLDVDGLIQDRTSRLKRIQNNIVSVLADMVDNRDKTTGGHIERTTAYVKTLANAMSVRGVYTDELRSWDIEAAAASASLHDVGKVMISDNILNKPGQLTPDEFEMMKTHVSEGERIIDLIIEKTGQDNFLINARLFAGYHHERWDGSGYPYGLMGASIPLQGRMMAIPDVYDALVSQRPYKRALSDDEAARIIISESGKHFDPKIVEVFHEIRDSFKAITHSLVHNAATI